MRPIFGATPGSPLDSARAEAGLTPQALWLAYVGLGGSAGLPLFHEWLRGNAEPTTAEHNVVVHALNEHFNDLDLNHPVPYIEGP